MFAANTVWAQWEPDVRLTNDPAGSFTTINSAWGIAANGDTVHTVWYDNRDGNNEIYYKRSLDGGLSWGEDTKLTNNPAIASWPAISVSGSVVHVAWTDARNGINNYEIYYKRSADGGSTWGEEIRLTNAPGNSWLTSMSVSGSNVYVVWYDGRVYGNWEIYYKRSTDGGISWGPDTQLTFYTTYALYASISISGPVVHVVWFDNRDGDEEIYYKRSEDEGLTWEEDIRLTNDPAQSRLPSIAVSGSIVNVVWQDDRDGNYEIYYKRSMDGGVIWGDDTRLTNASGDSKYTKIVLSGEVVHVVWFDNRDGDEEIYYKRSENEGLTWGGDIRLTNSSGASERPGIAVSGPVVHVEWFDLRDGNEEIYYKRNPTGGFPVGIENDKINNTAQQIIIYPNPASTHIHIKFNNEVNQSAGNKDEKNILSIRNIIGVELLSKQIRNGESDVDVSNLQNGLYFVGMTKSNNQSLNTKLIIQK
ncbi:MAG: T9SS C-terminal target domain-containing protein [Bacteroidetes bacterium]|nr:MAG: T9SS C-terminal target domain-containing protein [Bacteroidota bacterium]